MPSEIDMVSGEPKEDDRRERARPEIAISEETCGIRPTGEDDGGVVKDEALDKAKPLPLANMRALPPSTKPTPDPPPGGRPCMK